MLTGLATVCVSYGDSGIYGVAFACFFCLNVDLYGLYSSPYRLIRSRTIRRVGQVSGIGEERNTCIVVTENPEEKDRLELLK
jgi:hypothetical protein